MTRPCTRHYSFVHLHVHSYYSFFSSTLSPAEIVKWAATGTREARRGNSLFADCSRGDMLPTKTNSASSLPPTREEEHGAKCASPPCIALTDTNSMSGIVEFYKAAVEAGVKPILGIELTQPLAWERELWRLRAGELPAEDDEEEEHEARGSQSPQLCHGDLTKRVVALARNLEGYHELCRVATRRMLNPDFDLLEEIQGFSSNVILLSDWEKGLQVAAANSNAEVFAMLVAGRRRRRQNRRIYEQAHRLSVPLIVTGDVRMGAPADAPFLTLLHAMRRLIPLEQLGEEEHASCAEGYLMSPEEIGELFGVERGHALAAEIKRAMERTHEVAEACQCELPLRAWKLPRGEFLGERDASGYLRRLAWEGLQWRYPPTPPPEACERLRHELEIIEQTGFSSYFVMVHRIVEEARRRGFFTLGRGSAANSIVTYALGISHVCPLRNGLHFERFLNPERSSPPDIDLDFSWRERDEILRWCFEFFGHEHVALISTIQTLRTRQAVREVAKAYGLSEGEIRGFNRLQSTGYVVEDAEDMRLGERRKDGTLRQLSLEEPWRSILATASRLAGLPRHLSIHCGGVVIAPCRVTDWVPLTRSAKGFVITQMDMTGVEELGLIKMDLLSNRSLGVLKDALEAAQRNTRIRAEIRKEAAPQENATQPDARRQRVLASEASRMKYAGTRRGTSVALAGLLEQFESSRSPLALPSEKRNTPGELRSLIHNLDAIVQDEATRRLIHEGRTMGCFYIESPGMRALFERLRCREFGEVVAASSIIRPGVAESGMMEEYIERHQGKKSASDHPFPRVQALLQKLLPETYGVMVYQEDVLLVAHEVAGMSYGEADLLRRAMSGKTRSGEAMEAARERFVDGAMQRCSLLREEAEEIWRQIASFAGYSFCKGHSAAFAVLSYQVAYLKAHYPAEFFAAVLDNGGGFYGAHAYVEEARRWGLSILPPCVNEGEVEFCGETHEVRGMKARGWVRVGLGALREISRETCARIVRERKTGGRYRSLEDFLRRVTPQPHEARILARSGALDTLLPGTCHDVRARAAKRCRIVLELELSLRTAGIAQETEGLFTHAALLQETDSRTAAPLPSLEVEYRQMGRHEALGRLCRWELETVGFMVSGHPLDFIAIPRGAIAARDIRRYNGKKVRMIGWAIAAKELIARNCGKPMKMLTLEDRTDTFEAVLFPQVYERYAPRTVSCGPYVVEGRVDMRLGSPTLEVEEIALIHLELPS